MEREGLQEALERAHDSIRFLPDPVSIKPSYGTMEEELSTLPSLPLSLSSDLSRPCQQGVGGEKTLTASLCQREGLARGPPELRETRRLYCNSRCRDDDSWGWALPAQDPDR